MEWTNGMSEWMNELNEVKWMNEWTNGMSEWNGKVIKYINNDKSNVYK